MKKFAIIKTGGKQCLAEEGKEIVIEKIPGEPKDKVEFNEVLLFVDKEKINIGQPLVKSAKVVGEIKEQIKEKKIKVFKYRAKSRYRKTKGHRQNKTRVTVKKIIIGK